MKYLLLIIITSITTCTYAQFNQLKKAIEKPKSEIEKIIVQKNDSLSTKDIIEGIKEALSKGIEKGTAQLSSADGFFKNENVKILMPHEAIKVETSLRNVGMGNQVDAAILNMNRAAEEATKLAAPIFINAIKNMTITEAWNIFNGSNTAATNFLQEQVSVELSNSFKPIVDKALAKIDATKHWNTLFTNYNRFTLNKINPDLTEYVTQKALNGLFYQLALEEQKIRKDPAARTTEILKHVFGRN